MVNMDRIPGVLSSLGVNNIQVSALLDSPLWLDIEVAPGSSVVSLQSETQAVYSLVQPPADVIGAACAAQFQGQEWKCLYGQYRMPLGARPRPARIIDARHPPAAPRAAPRSGRGRAPHVALTS